MFAAAHLVAYISLDFWHYEHSLILGDSFEIITFGENDLPDLGIPVKITHAGILNAESLSNLYQRCTAGLVLSGTNYSLVPNEMMACGLPVVDIDATHTRLSYTPKQLYWLNPTLRH